MMYDVVVIGGGPAGMSAAIESAENGGKTLIIERNGELGGILNQCIHNGFGLHYFGEELTGPEYALKFANLVSKNKNITIMLSTFVVDIADKMISKKDKSTGKKNKVEVGEVVTVINSDGLQKIETKSVVLAMGCRERTAGGIMLVGTRPSGIYTAGCVQKMVNIYGKLPGKKVAILGSGDIGLIMARRLTIEGAKVLGVLEINKTSSGLRRNISQCLDDFDISLMTSTTVFEVVGDDRIKGIWYGQVDENFNKIESTKKYMEIDTLVLSVGLVPESDLVPNLPVNRVTNGTYVDEYYETVDKGVFACGNVLHVHDLADNATIEAKLAGKYACLSAKGKLVKGESIKVTAGAGISYVLPDTIYKGDGQVDVKFRLKQKAVKTSVIAVCGKEIVGKKYMLAGVPGEMMSVPIDKSKLTGDVIIRVENL